LGNVKRDSLSTRSERPRGPLTDLERNEFYLSWWSWPGGYPKQLRWHRSILELASRRREIGANRQFRSRRAIQSAGDSSSWTDSQTEPGPLQWLRKSICH